ncbi:MAG: hypothetical protein JWN54_586 [Mycobacterium sp.]|nr:hypothetical protein [Mycobacterium sp.]
MIEEAAAAVVGAATTLGIDHVRKRRHGADSPRPLFIAALRLRSGRGLGGRCGTATSDPDLADWNGFRSAYGRYDDDRSNSAN